MALGFRPHTFGDRKNTLDRKKGALPWWISLILVHVTTPHCCLGPRIPKAPGRFRKVSFAWHRGPGKPGQETAERGTGFCLCFSMLTLQSHSHSIPLPPVYLSVEDPHHCLSAHPYSTPTSLGTGQNLGTGYLLALVLVCTSCLLHSSAPSVKRRCVSRPTSQWVS